MRVRVISQILLEKDMYSRRQNILLILITLLSACSPAESLKTVTPLAPTNTPIATITPAPANTPIPLPIPSFDGPKLIYKVYKKGFTTSIEMMNKDGTGHKTILTPEEGDVSYLSTAVSPDGKWLAFQSGTWDDHNSRLNLLSIESGEKQAITYLLSEDYPDNFQKAVDKIKSSKTDLSKDDEISVGTIAMNFRVGQTAWSPDSRYLAFAGEMDGPTSDLYIYDVQEKTITRLTDDLLNIGSINWSSDGKQIYFSNIRPGIIYSWNIYYAINFETRKIQKQDIPGWGQYDGCVEQFCLSHFQGDGGDPRDISLTNMNTGKSKILWAQAFQFYAISPTHHGIAVSGYSDSPNPGTYFIDFDGNKKKISDLYFGELAFWDGKEPFVIGGRQDGIFTITLDGKVKKVYSTGYYSFSSSPNNHTFIAYLGNFDEPQAKGLILFAENGSFIRLVGEDMVRQVIWRPDSQGFFYRTDKGPVYYLQTPTGDPAAVPDSDDISLTDTVWIP